MKSLFSLSLLVGAAIAHASYQMPEEYVPHQVIVSFGNSSLAQKNSANRHIGATVVEESLNHDWTLVSIPNNMSERSAIDYYNSLSNVRYAEANGICHAAFTPNDPYYLNNVQFGPQLIHCPGAWDVTQGSAGVVIAIIDTGAQLTHPDLAAKFVAGYNFVANNTNPVDDNGHGTHCSGIAAAVTNNGLGIAGVSFNCSIMPVKVLNSGGSGTWTAVAQGVNFAWQNGAKVLSMSLGGTGAPQSLQDAVNAAWNNGDIVVCAAGNNGSTSAFWPAYYTNSIAVASVDSNDFRSSFSNYGDWVDVAAPGGNVYSTWPTNTYTYLSGTSMACPHVAGEAGLLWAKNGTNTPVADIRNFIESTTDNVGRYGIHNGRINCDRAVHAGGPTTVYPTSYGVFRGVYDSGTVADLLVSDDSYLVVHNGVTALRTESPITIDFYGTSPVGVPTSMSLQMENHVSINGLTQRMSEYNYIAGTYDLVDTVTASTTDIVRTVNISGPSNYVGTNNTLDARLLIRADGPVFTATWRSYTDQVSWTIQ